jgi:hypothetical protein
MGFNLVGLSESVDDIIDEEVRKSVNPAYDGEQIKYKSYNTDGYNLTFRFYDENSNSFTTDYTAAGFDLPLDYSRNVFKKSYFRLYFYDVNEPQNRNLLFYEEIDVYNTTTPVIPLKKLYWFRNDTLFKDTLQNRDVYMIARFFNAKTGKIQDFINTPISTTTPLTITQYSNNSDWWSSPIRIINPKNNNGEYNFTTVVGVGANTINSITLTEQIIT